MSNDDLTHRDRPQQGNHIRAIQVQTLDALLRIEELLIALVGAKAHDDTKVSAVLLPAPVVKEEPKVGRFTGRRKQSL